MVARQDEAAGAGFGAISVATARMPDGRIGGQIAGGIGLDQLGLADRLAARRRCARAIEPASCSMASGRSLLRMKLAPADAAGHICQRKSLGATVLPVPISLLATSTSTVSSCATGPGRRRRSIGSARQQRRNTAGGNRNPEYNDTRGFHTLHFPQ